MRGLVVGLMVTAAVVTGAGIVSRGVATAATDRAADSFERADGAIGTSETGQPWRVVGQTCFGCSPLFQVAGRRARIARDTGYPTVGHAVVGTGLTSGYRVDADISMSPTPERANVGLSAMFRNGDNHLFCKIEVSHGNPLGLLTIGKTQAAHVTSLLAFRRQVGLRTDTTYHLALAVPTDPRSDPVTCTVSDTGGRQIASVKYRLNSSEMRAFGTATEQGLRIKVEFDEDDSGSTWDDFRVSTDTAPPAPTTTVPSTTTPPPATTIPPPTTTIPPPATTIPPPATTIPPPTTTIPPPSTTTPPPPTNDDCVVSRDGGVATLVWGARGGQQVVRRDGRWLTTLAIGTSSYVDATAPDGAAYLIRSSLGGLVVEHLCGPALTGPLAPAVRCRLQNVGPDAQLSWVDEGGVHVVRRDDAYLATAGTGVAGFIDANAPVGASYVVRTWTGTQYSDRPCG